MKIVIKYIRQLFLKYIFNFKYKTITEKELLGYCLKDAKAIANSQHLDIDNDYNLIQYGQGYKDGKFITKPIIEIDDSSERMVIINIKYQIIPEHINITELKMSKPKSIFTGKKIYNFNKVIK
jgi:hypothetical protein